MHDYLARLTGETSGAPCESWCTCARISNKITACAVTRPAPVVQPRASYCRRKINNIRNSISVPYSYTMRSLTDTNFRVRRFLISYGGRTDVRITSLTRDIRRTCTLLHLTVRNKRASLTRENYQSCAISIN